MSGVLETKAVVLVANKTDLVRKRIVKTAGTVAVHSTISTVQLQYTVLLVQYSSSTQYY